jgi:hypothetical protein
LVESPAAHGVRERCFLKEFPMTFPRRLWLAGLLMLTLGVTSPARAVDPKILPGGTELLISVNIKQMLQSDVAQQYKEVVGQAKIALEGQIQNNPGAKYLEKAGFDLLRDLHSVTIASDGTKDFQTGVLILEGKFDPDKIQTSADEFARDQPEQLKISRIGTTRVFEITPPGDKRGYAALLNSQTMIVSPSQEAIKDAIGGAARKPMKEGFKALLKTTSSKQSFSFVATGPALAKLAENAPVPNADAAAGMLQNLEGISAAITLGKDIQFQVGINAKDEETAKKTVAYGNFGLLTIRTLAAQKAKEDERLQPLVDISKTLRITSEGNNMILRGEVSIETLERLIKVLPKNFNP